MGIKVFDGRIYYVQRNFEREHYGVEVRNKIKKGQFRFEKIGRIQLTRQFCTTPTLYAPVNPASNLTSLFKTIMSRSPSVPSTGLPRALGPSSTWINTPTAVSRTDSRSKLREPSSWLRFFVLRHLPPSEL